MKGFFFKSFTRALALTAMVALGGCAGQPFTAASETARSLPPSGTAAATGNVPTGDALSGSTASDEAWRAFRLYRASVSITEKRKWICIAVNEGLPEAEAELARLHWPRPGDPPSPFDRDMAQAYAWSLLAIENGQPMQVMEERLGSAMSADERWRATAQAALWKPGTSHCNHVEGSGCLHAS